MILCHDRATLVENDRRHRTDLRSEGVDFGDRLLLIHLEHREALTLLFSVYLLDVRQLLLTGNAPRRPEIHQHDLSPQVGEADELPIDIGEREVWGWLIDGR